MKERLSTGRFDISNYDPFKTTGGPGNLKYYFIFDEAALGLEKLRAQLELPLCNLQLEKLEEARAGKERCVSTVLRHREG